MAVSGSMKADEIAARIERLPFTRWQVKARLIVGVATFFDAFDALAIAYVLPVLIPAFSLSLTQVSLIISMGFVGQLIGALVFGRVAERIGRLKTTLITVAIFTSMSFLVAGSWSFTSLLIFRVLQGIGLGGEVPLAASYISELTKAKGRGRFVLLYELIFPLGLMAAAVAGYLIVPTLGWRWLFILGGVPALLVLYMRWALPESPRWLANVGRDDEAEQAMTYIEERVKENTGTELPAPRATVDARPEIQTRVSELFSHMYLPRTLVLWTIWFTSYFATYGITAWLPSIYQSVFGLPLEQSLRYSLLTTFAGLIGALACALLIDRIGRRAWIGSALIFGGASLVALWLIGAPTASSVLLWTAIGYFFISSVSLAIYLYTPELYPTRLRAFGTSMGSAWLRLASIIGPIFVGAVLAAGSVATVFLGFGIVALVGGLITAFFATETKNRVLEEVSP